MSPDPKPHWIMALLLWRRGAETAGLAGLRTCPRVAYYEKTWFAMYNYFAGKLDSNL